MKPRIYLDIDGVLNSTKGNKIAIERYPNEIELLREDMLKHKHLLHRHWDEEAVSNLRKLVVKTNPDIYIHSTWRHHFKLREIKKYFDYWGINSDHIIDFVPQYKFSAERYHILAWHIEGERCGGPDVEPCTNYVILDDYDMTYIFKDKGYFDRQIVVNPAVGLTEEDKDKAISMLCR